MRDADRWLIAGAVAFVAGAAAVLTFLNQGNHWLLVLGLIGLAGAVVCFGIGTWRIQGRVDWDRIEAEQRLWESGPLGRIWLKIRQVLLRR